MDDSSGKSKFGDVRVRGKVLTTTFVLGVCLGLLVSERVYLASNRDDITNGIASRRVALAEGGRHVAAVPAAPCHSTDPNTPCVEPELLRRNLKAYLETIAPTGEVLVGVSNWRPLMEGMLGTFLGSVEQAGVKNYVVVCLDKQTETALLEKGQNAFYMPAHISNSQKDTGENHAISALKFGILRTFLELGWATLLSDIDVAVLQNPFHHLYRDSDVEGMTDGFDPPTAYGAIDGFEDASMGWARFAQLYKHFNMNSGLFYLKANSRTIELMARLETRLAKQKYWDQTAYNEEIFFLSHDDYKSPQVTVRVMSIFKFMNSKVLFKDVRHRPASQQPPMPVMVHINYHPDKHERMRAVIEYYLKGQKNALDRFPGGSEPGS